jgi:hypothetical protein
MPNAGAMTRGGREARTVVVGLGRLARGSVIGAPRRPLRFTPGRKLRGEPTEPCLRPRYDGPAANGSHRKATKVGKAHDDDRVASDGVDGSGMTTAYFEPEGATHDGVIASTTPRVFEFLTQQRKQT